jgi:uncharacterized membrane protein YbhN (UPF0104 family)
MGAALIAVLLLYFYHALDTWIIILVVIFCLLAAGIPAIILWLRKADSLPAVMLHIPGLKKLIATVADSPGGLLSNHKLLLATIGLRGLIFVLDALTLSVILHMMSIPAAFQVAFPSFIIASIVATISSIPMGLGTFEVACVSMLGILGVPIEAALAATLLLRGFTLWLPILPGIWLTRRALRH